MAAEMQAGSAGCRTRPTIQCMKIAVPLPLLVEAATGFAAMGLLVKAWA